MKEYRCIPIAAGLPIIFLMGSLLHLGFTWYYWIDTHDSEYLFVGLFFAIFAFCFALFTAMPAIRRIEILPQLIICRGLFPWNTFEIKYEDCNIGMDYHRQNHNKIWWIYLCYGSPPQYKHKSPTNRINSVKIRHGFVKIMYSDEVYNDLIEVLPKKQRTALITARRCAGFEKQGKIVFNP